MRIFKSEVKEMGNDSHDAESRPAQPAPREVEGRVVDPAPAPAEPQRAATPAEHPERDR
jgi:hypothetical protein